MRASTGEDCLIVSISFKDGNGDVGFNATNPDDSDSPYHDINFFTNKAGVRTATPSFLIKNFTGYALGKTKKTPKQPSYFILSPAANSGELITLQHRSEGFPSLPPYTDPFKCAAYSQSWLNQNDLPDTIFIRRTESSVDCTYPRASSGRCVACRLAGGDAAERSSRDLHHFSAQHDAGSRIL